VQTSACVASTAASAPPSTRLSASESESESESRVRRVRLNCLRPGRGGLSLHPLALSLFKCYHSPSALWQAIVFRASTPRGSIMPCKVEACSGLHSLWSIVPNKLSLSLERWNMLESITLVQGSGCKVQGVGFTLQPVGFTLRCSQVSRAHLSRDLCPSPSDLPFPLTPSLAHPPSDDVALKYWCWRRGEEPLHAEYGQVQRGVSSVYHQLSHSSPGCWGLLQPVA